MNILISAYSVNPYRGSEDSIGWNWVLQHEKNYKEGDRIILLTKKYNEKDTRKGFQQFGIEHVELAITDVPNCLNWFREKHSVFHHMYYILWQKWAYMWVRKSGINFDIIHHITMNDYRIPGEMYKFRNAYTIFGPVGGAQCTPRSLKCYEKNKAVAQFREFINKSCDFNPLYRKAIKNFKKIYAINEETQMQLEQIRGEKIEILPELALRKEFKNVKTVRSREDTFRIVFVGRLIGKKGVMFLLDSLAYLPNGLKWRLDVFGDGTERNAIERKITNLQFEDKVYLHGNTPFEEIAKAYSNSDVFILPSLRETSGNVLLEAMAYKLPIIAMNTSFCRTLKKKNCGIFIESNQSIELIQQQIAEAVVQMISDEELRLRLGENGYRFANEELTWDKKYQKIYVEDYKL